MFDDFAGDFARFSHGKTADRIAVKIHVDQAGCAFSPEGGVHAPLDDAVQALSLAVALGEPGHTVCVGAEMGQRPCRPGMRQVHAAAGALPCGGVLSAFVEGHADVGTEGDLYVHAVFRRKEVLGTIKVRAKLDAIGRDFAQGRQGKDLEAATVGQHGPVPAHKFVHAAGPSNQFVTRPQVQVVGVGQDDLGTATILAQRFKHLLRHGFYTGGRTHGHKDWSFNRAMREVERAPARVSGYFVHIEAKRHHSMIVGI